MIQSLQCPLCNNFQINVDFELPSHSHYFKSIDFEVHQSPEIPPHRLYITSFDNVIHNIYIYLDNSIFFTLSFSQKKIFFGLFGPVQIPIGTHFNNEKIIIDLPLSYINFDLDYFSILNFVKTQLIFK